MIEVPTETTIRVTARLYEMRSIVRRMKGKRYAETMETFQAIIKRVAAQQNLDDLGAASWLAKRVDPDDAFEKMCIFAAWVEMTQPTQASEGGVKP